MEVYTTDADPDEYEGSVEPLGRCVDRIVCGGGERVGWLAEADEVRSVERACVLLNIAELCVLVPVVGYGCEAESIIDLAGA